MATVTISIPETLKQFVESQIVDKGYGDISEYVGMLLRDAQIKDSETRLEALLLEGEASGEAIPVDDLFWRDLKVEAEGLKSAHRSKKTGA